MILYDYVLSPNCYKVRLMTALLGRSLDRVAVDIHPGHENREAAFLALNPAGTVPVLQTDDGVIADSAAILLWLAGRYGPEWLADRGPDTARMQQWLDFSAALTDSLGAARAHDIFDSPGGIDALRARGTAHLRMIEEALVEGAIEGRRFLAADHPTIADIACFPHVALAPDGGVSVDDYPAIRLWMRALRGLPGFIEMPGIHRRHDLLPEPSPEAEAEAETAIALVTAPERPV